jgi:hypothetical protein
LTAVAKQAYDNNHFGDLPRLGDLLYNSGCRDETLLSHLRYRGRHYRGCWALDAILGKGHGNALLSERDWLDETHPFYMLNWWKYFRGEPSSRKRRLLACAACRLVWHLFVDKCLRDAVECAEAYLDGRISKSELQRLHEQAHALGLARGEVLGTMSGNSPGRQTLVDSWRVAHAAAEAAGPDNSLFGNAMHHVAQDGGSGRDTKDAGQAALIREILGDSPHPVAIDPRWLTSTVLDLAHEIYDEVAYERMPILADALMDAGCNNEGILNHCRSKGPHVRGCWVLDSLLSKE